MASNISHLAALYDQAARDKLKKAMDIFSGLDEAIEEGIMTIGEALGFLNDYTQDMRNISLSGVREVMWTDQELEDPEKQKLVLSGSRKWICKNCKKETIDTRVPRGCLHYYKFSTHLTFTVFHNE